MTEITKNLNLIKQHLPEEVRLIAVSKTFDAAAVREAYLAGQRDFGENKVQELLLKSQTLSDLKDIRWHFIGHLQSNKARDVLRVPHLTMIHSIDRIKIAEILNEKLRQDGRFLDVLIQINTSGENSKYGSSPEKTLELVRHIADTLPQLRINGVMTIGKLAGSSDEIQQCFSMLRKIAGEINAAAIPNVSMQILSMGMTSDYQIALKEGSNMVRIGQAIFGKRHIPDQHYWPEV